MRKKRNALTLIETMLVIILIGIIGGAMAYNLKGAVEKGRSFKTKETKHRIDTVLNMAFLEGKSAEEIREDWKHIVETSPLIKAKKNESHLRDGWNEEFHIEMNDDGMWRSFTGHISPDAED